MTAKTTAKKASPLILNWMVKDRQVLVVPQDEDRFMISVEAAVKACQAVDKTLLFQKQFRDTLLPRLAVWISERTDRLDKAYLTVREDGLLFVAIQKSPEYDRQFEDDLSGLDMEIARDPNLDLVDLEVLALPNASAAAHASFLNPEGTLQYRAQRK